MKSITVLFGIALCLAVIGPTCAKPSASGDHNEHQNEKQIRHRPKRQFPNHYGYYQQWPGQFQQRRDDRDLLPHIYRLLEELSDFVRRPPPPPPPPQPIFIPYPIQYPQYCQCGGGSGSNQVPNITNRWPDMEDKRQNWGFDDTEEQEENYGVNARPINFDRIPPPSSTTRPPPSVDHGTSQAAQNPRVNLSRRLQRCDASVLSCCSPQDKRPQHQKCFALSGCADYFDKNDVCSTEHVQEVLDLFTAAYQPTRQ